MFRIHGSSPHTRGALILLTLPRRRRRIIPAYAGSTFPSLASTSARRDHPRIRGEHRTTGTAKSSPCGSSPHTRGARAAARRRRRRGGIIPAYAGSTGDNADYMMKSRDHPRIRGEHAARGREGAREAGSSPHTRGALRNVSHITPPGRIIPAYAGSTGPPARSGAAGEDHPRIRGEHPPLRPWPSAPSGSSPHTRGARRPERQPPLGRRIIPAYAGSTAATAARITRIEDHPRIRGEHGAAPRKPWIVMGSSPHTRGAPVTLGVPAAPIGIIPAYAGSTALRDPRRPVLRDHPRIRGEHRRGWASAGSGRGSSPHTRGARWPARA